MKYRLRLTAIAFFALLLTACGDSTPDPTPMVITPTPDPIPPPAPVPDPTPVPPPMVILPAITSVSIQTTDITRYNKVEMQLEISAEFTNPYDQRQIDLSATFTLPDGNQMKISGFWDGEANWLMRLTPSMAGEWQYSMQVEDERGISEAVEGTFNVANSTKKGWLQTGDKFDPNYSSRYLVHHDGSPFYGMGHGDAFSIFRTSTFVNETNRLVDNMDQAGENYVLWWPQFYFSVVEENFDNYSLENLQLIDGVLDILEAEDKVVIFTIWDHSQLRDFSHPWADGNWDNTNGFSHLLSATDFFTDQEAWAWQANLYRYMIARWGHNTSLAMWQTVSEIDGTNAFNNSNDWHKKINDYFAENDPYNHPTTASMAGDLTWDIGHSVMDLPQVHIYQDLLDQADTTKALTVETAKVIADYTAAMWQLEPKPNWIGEFGVLNSAENHYPELFHNAIWAALGAGAAMTPAEWNDFDRWGVMSADMKNHMRYLRDFVASTPLAKWNPSALTVRSDSLNIRSWGVAGREGGLVWVQDHALAGLSITQIRQQRTTKSGASVILLGLESGTYQISPYNTWLGQFGTSFTVTCDGGVEAECLIPLPDFIDDIAFRIDRL